MSTIVLIIEIVALCIVLVSDNSKTGYAIRCVVDGIFLGSSAAHLVPGTALYDGTMLDLVFNAVFAIMFAYFTYDNYKRWKNAK